MVGRTAPRVAAKARRVLGIDPGLQRTGYACLELSARGAVCIVDAGVFRLSARTPLVHRLGELAADLEAVLSEYRPSHMVVESVFSRPKHPATSILMAHARGVILLAAGQRSLGLTELSPTAVKKALTGNGHATKRQVQSAVMARCGLAKPPRPADVADAIAIAICGAERLPQRGLR